MERERGLFRRPQRRKRSAEERSEENKAERNKSHKSHRAVASGATEGRISKWTPGHVIWITAEEERHGERKKVKTEEKRACGRVGSCPENLYKTKRIQS